MRLLGRSETHSGGRLMSLLVPGVGEEVLALSSPGSFSGAGMDG